MNACKMQHVRFWKNKNCQRKKKLKTVPKFNLLMMQNVKPFILGRWEKLEKKKILLCRFGEKNYVSSAKVYLSLSE